MIADSLNKRIQVFTRKRLFKDSFPTADEPVSVATDIYYNVIVGTNERTIEIYRRGGKLVNRFSTFPSVKLKVQPNRTSNLHPTIPNGFCMFRIQSTYK